MKFMTSDEQMLRKALVTGSYWPTTFEPGAAQAKQLEPLSYDLLQQADSVAAHVPAREVRDAAGVHRRVDQPVAGVRAGRPLHRGLPGRALGRGAAAAMSAASGMTSGARVSRAPPRSRGRGAAGARGWSRPRRAWGAASRCRSLPAVLLFGAFFVVPLGVVVVTSISDWGPLGLEFTGLENYRHPVRRRRVLVGGPQHGAVRRRRRPHPGAGRRRRRGRPVAAVPRLAAAAHDLLPPQHRLRRGARPGLRDLLQPALRAPQPGARRRRPGRHARLAVRRRHRAPRGRRHLGVHRRARDRARDGGDRRDPGGGLRRGARRRRVALGADAGTSRSRCCATRSACA